MRQIKLAAAIVSIIIYSCNSDSSKSEKFVGRWIDATSLINSNSSHPRTEDFEILIAKVGQNFTFTSKGQTVPAFYNKELDKLEVTEPRSLQKIEFIYNPKTKQLIGPNITLEKWADKK